MKKFRTVAFAAAFAVTSQFAVITPANAFNIWPCLDALSTLEGLLTFFYGRGLARLIVNDLAIECTTYHILG